MSTRSTVREYSEYPCPGAPGRLQQSILECVRELNDRTSTITTACGLTADNSSMILIVSLVTSERGRAVVAASVRG